MTFFWAWLAGVLTLINPCVLPLLPVIIAGAFQGNRHGPIYMALGLTVSFTVVGVLVTAFGHLIGLSESTINKTAAVLMLIFGIILLIPRAQEKLATARCSVVALCWTNTRWCDWSRSFRRGPAAGHRHHAVFWSGSFYRTVTAFLRFT